MNPTRREVGRIANLAVTAALCAALTLAVAAMATTATAAPSFSAQGYYGLRGGYSMEVLVDGVPVPEYSSGGATYIEAFKGREYSIRLTNHTPRRIAVALSVDGLNSIDAKTTTAAAASKWILGPYQSITLEGWQTSSDTARRFFFSNEQGSYGAWLGRTRNLGIITAAVFRERYPRPSMIMKEKDAPGDSRLREESSGPRPAAPQSGMDSLSRQGAAEPERFDDLAATGIGQEVGHQVRRIPFDAEASPAAVLNIRYEFRDALVRLGVLVPPEPPCEDGLARRQRARGFSDMDFAPDPYRSHRR